jgi:phospholipase C
MPNNQTPKIDPQLNPNINAQINSGGIRDAINESAQHIAEQLAAAEKRRKEIENLQNKVDRIVVLMMENRSFDQMLGWLGPARGGLTGNERNHEKVYADGSPDVSSPSYTVQAANDTAFAFVDPKHASVTTVHEQIGGGRMSGFVQAFRVTKDERSHSHVSGQTSRYDWRRATLDMPMRYFTRNAVPTYAFFSDEFAVCSQYFCSVPSGTWPNRLFFYAGTCNGQLGNGDVLHPNDTYHDNMPGQLFVDQLTQAGVSWKIYTHTFAWLNLFPDRGAADNNTRSFSHFADDCEAGTLPKVTLIDPNWIDVGVISRANDDHAPADVANGQNFVADIYRALCSQPGGFGRTLFVVTYDEHGGWYDHVAPPATIGNNGAGLHEDSASCGFESYGVRVPTFVVSPFIPKQSTFTTVLDHCSLHATITRTFCPMKSPLSQRVAKANSLSDLLSLSAARTMPVMAATRSLQQSHNDAPATYALDHDDRGFRAWVAKQQAG